MATLIDHMVPPFKKGGLYAELAALNELVSDHHQAESKNTELAAAFEKRIREQVAERTDPETGEALLQAVPAEQQWLGLDRYLNR